MLRRTLAIALLGLACTGNASADGKMAPFDPVPGFAPPSIIFDEPTGKDGMWAKDLPCSANRATVTVKFDKAYHSDNWAPVAKIRLDAPKSGDMADTSSLSVAAVVQGPTDAHKIFALVWAEKVTGSQSEGPGYSPADLEAPLQIDLAWTPDGVVNVNFGGQFATRMTISNPVTRIGLAVSWAKFEFINLKVGHAGPPAPPCASNKNDP